MFKHYFEQINGIAIWPVISLIIFFAFFIGLIWWVVTVDNKYIREMENKPIDKDDSEIDLVKPIKN